MGSRGQARGMATTWKSAATGAAAPPARSPTTMHGPAGAHPALASPYSSVRISGNLSAVDPGWKKAVSLMDPGPHWGQAVPQSPGTAAQPIVLSLIEDKVGGLASLLFAAEIAAARQARPASMSCVPAGPRCCASGWRAR